MGDIHIMAVEQALLGLPGSGSLLGKVGGQSWGVAPALSLLGESLAWQTSCCSTAHLPPALCHATAP